VLPFRVQKRSNGLSILKTLHTLTKTKQSRSNRKD
jgi:hypothetical protein